MFNIAKKEYYLLDLNSLIILFSVYQIHRRVLFILTKERSMV